MYCPGGCRTRWMWSSAWRRWTRPWARAVPKCSTRIRGVQFTSASYTGRLETAGAKVSMDGKGRCLDNVFVERLWQTVKYEEVYLWRHETVATLQSGLRRYFVYYN